MERSSLYLVYLHAKKYIYIESLPVIIFIKIFLFFHLILSGCSVSLWYCIPEVHLIIFFSSIYFLTLNMSLNHQG